MKKYIIGLAHILFPNDKDYTLKEALLLIGVVVALVVLYGWISSGW